MKQLREQLTYANVVATLALMAAVAGIPTAVAVTSASKQSDVTTKGKLRAGRVTTVKLADGAVTAAKFGQIDVVQRTGVGGATASCSGGERLIGGGASTTGGASLSGSVPAGNTWSVTTTGAPTPATTAYALCLKG